MKVWEKIVAEFNDTKHMDREALRAEMYMHRMLPCEENEENEWLTEEQMAFVCNVCDCDNCLDRYLDTELEPSND